MRWPAAKCGLVGHRPTLGRHRPRRPAAVRVSLDTVGVMARDTRRRAGAAGGGRGGPRRRPLAERLRNPSPPPLRVGCGSAYRAIPLGVLDGDAVGAHGVSNGGWPTSAPAWSTSTSRCRAGRGRGLGALAGRERRPRDVRRCRRARSWRSHAASSPRAHAAAGDVDRARRLPVMLRDAVLEAFDAARLDALLVPASPLGAVRRDGRPAQLPAGTAAAPAPPTSPA